MLDLIWFTLIWMIYWVCLLSSAMGTIYLIIDRFSHDDLDSYNHDVDKRIRAAELERLRQLPTKSRIGRKPDL